MYKLITNPENGNISVADAPMQGEYKGQLWGNFPSFLSRQPIDERQAEGWFSTITPSVSVSLPVAVFGEEDTIYIPMPMPIEDSVEPPADPVIPSVISYDKVKLLRAMLAIGALESFKTLLNSDSNFLLFWNASKEIDSNDPMFLAAADQLLAAGMTVETIAKILKESEVSYN